MNRCRQCSAFLWNGLPKPNSWENILAGNLWKGDASYQESGLLSCLKNGPAPRRARRSGTERPAILLTQCGSRRTDAVFARIHALTTCERSSLPRYGMTMATALI